MIARCRIAADVGRFRGSGARVALAVACMFVAAGCRDDSTPAAPPTLAGPFALSNAEALTITDPSINVGDTYLVTTSVTRTSTTLESGEPFVDPLTGQQVTRLELPAVVDSTRFEAGYDAAGTVRLTEYHAGNDSGGVAARVEIVGNTATFFDAYGAPVHDTSGAILMEAIGPLDDVIVTSDAVLRADEPLAAASSSAAPRMGVGRTDQAVSREEQRDGRLYRISSLDDPGAGKRGERTRQYRRSGSYWVLAEERSQISQSVGRMSYSVVQTTTFPVVKWKSNEAKDAARRDRAARRAARGESWVAPLTTRAASTAPARPTFQPEESGETIATVPASCLLCASDDGGVIVASGSVTPTNGMNVVFQHGGFADAGSWYRMDPWISARYPISRKVKSSLNWRAGIESQSASLRDQMLGNGGSGYLMIGHSNGGLISRRVGQMEIQAGGPLVNGVVAIATPHHGLPFAQNSRAAMTSQLSAYLSFPLAQIGGSCWRKEFAWLCPTLNDALLTLVPRIVNFAFDAAAPMTSDVRPGSPFLAQLNARNENFLQYSVEIESQGAWKFVRMAGDWKCEPEDRCSGHHMQNAMESIYDVLRVCGSNFIVRIVKSGLAEKCNDVRWSLSALNLAYERLTAPNDGSDGLVPMKSQKYPGISEEDRIVMRRAKESHVGQLKSSSVREAISTAITRYRKQPA